MNHATPVGHQETIRHFSGLTPPSGPPKAPTSPKPPTKRCRVNAARSGAAWGLTADGLRSADGRLPGPLPSGRTVRELRGPPARRGESIIRHGLPDGRTWERLAALYDDVAGAVESADRSIVVSGDCTTSL